MNFLGFLSVGSWFITNGSASVIKKQMEKWNFHANLGEFLNSFKIGTQNLIILFHGLRTHNESFFRNVLADVADHPNKL